MMKPSLYFAILGVVALGLMVMAFGDGWEKLPPFAYQSHLQPVREGQQDALRRAQFSNGKLWLLSDAGQLWMVDEASSVVRREPFDDPVLDVCVLGETTAAVTAPEPTGTTWTLWTRTGAADWVEVSPIGAGRDEGLAALLCGPTGVALLTSRRLVAIEGGKLRATHLSQRLPAAGASTTLVQHGAAFVGANVGEWGGGLHRVDLLTGVVETIHRNSSGELCGGPLNTECDPVHGIVASPWKPGCIVAAVGLMHMGSRGRLVEVCGSQVQRVYLGPCPVGEPRAGRVQPGEDEPFCTEAFYGLAVDGDDVVTIGTSGLTRLDRAGVAEVRPLPAFKEIGPFRIAFEPGMALVESSFNQRHALSGTTTTMVQRRATP